MSTTFAAPASIRRAARPRSARAQAWREEIVLALAFVLLVGSVFTLSLAGASAIARPVYMAAGLAFAVVTLRRSPWLFLSANMWFWLTTAFVRRVLEWRSGFIPTDVVLVTPNLMAVFIVPGLLTCPGLFNRRGIGYAMLVLGAVCCGLAVSFFRGDVLAGAISSADWIIPILYLLLFIRHAERIGEADVHIEAMLTLTLLWVVPYSIYQYFSIPDWDAIWVLASGMGSVGQNLSSGMRVFGPLNNPGFLATFCGTCLVLSSYFRNKLLLVLAPFVLLLVAMSLVRAVYGSVLLALAVGALSGRGGFGRLFAILVIAGLTTYVAADALDPVVSRSITQRITSMQQLGSDDSAESRKSLWSETPALIDANPLGLGIGGQGRGNAADGGREVSTINIDSGPLSVYAALGWVPGTLYILGMLAIAGRALLVGRRRNSPAAAAMASAAICPLATFPFINVVSFAGMLMWTCVGFAIAVDTSAAMLERRAKAKA